MHEQADLEILHDMLLARRKLLRELACLCVRSRERIVESRKAIARIGQ